MDLVNQYISEMKRRGIAEKYLNQEQGENYITISIKREIEEGTIYTTLLVFYDNNKDVEIFIRKNLEQFDADRILNIVNNLNCEYRDLVFYLRNSSLMLKTYVQTEDNIGKILSKEKALYKIAVKEFPDIY